MRLPIHTSLDKTAEELEARLRETIRKDKLIAPAKITVGSIVFAHATGAVAYMYSDQYAVHRERLETVLNQMGWKWARAFQAPTCHAAKLRSVP